MIAANVEGASSWAVFGVFHWSVWLALGGTCVAVGLVVSGRRLGGGWEAAGRCSWEVVEGRELLGPGSCWCLAGAGMCL